jgi:hypothetical protein
MRSGLSHIGGVHAHFMEEQMVETVEVLHIPHAFGEIRTQQRPELLFIGRINQFHLIEAVENFRSRYPHSRRTTAGNKFLD